MRRVTGLLFGAVFAAGMAFGQLTFTYQTNLNPAPIAITPSSPITFPQTTTGSSSTVTVTVTNIGSDSVPLGAASVSGSPAYTLLTPGVTTLAPQGTFSYNISFAPTTGGSADGVFSIQYQGSTPGTASFPLTGNAVAPQFVLSYVTNPNGNQTALSDGSTITFTAPSQGQTSTVTIVVQNKSTVTDGILSTVSLSGTGFQLTGLPLLPADVPPSGTVTFTVAFTPVSSNPVTATLTLTVGATVVRVNLTGQAALRYEAVINNQVQVVSPNPGLVMPSTNLGATSSATFLIMNTGTAPATISSILVQSTAFRLTDLPALPATVQGGQMISFTVVFAPTAPGQVSTKLQINSDQITLSGLGIGPSLSFASTIGSAVTVLDPNTPLVFTNTPVGGRTSATVQITNNGNAAGSITSLAVTSGPYAITAAPGLPVVIAPNGTAVFTIVFIPQAIGNATGVLQADNLTFNLRGVGTAPPTLPAVGFTTVPSQVQPLDQPSIGVSLASPYPSDVTGQLTLSFSSASFGDDSSIQFATGGRTITFQIPANSTDAVFFTGNKTVAFQAGTVAGTITFQATFNVGQAGITPAPVPTTTVTVPSLAPTIRSVQVNSRSATSLELLISGYSTPRSVKQLMLNFAATPGDTLQGANLSADVEFSFTTWYQSTASQPFGSQFTATVSISITGDANALNSVSVTASNAIGTSNAVSTTLH